MDQQPTLCRTLTQYQSIKQMYMSQRCMQKSIDYIAQNDGHCISIECDACPFDVFAQCSIEQSYHYAQLLRRRSCHETA